MRNRRWWGMGLLGIALAGTVVLVAPAAEPQAASAQVDAGSSAQQPDRAVQQEANALASRIDGAIRRSGTLLDTIALGDLGVFERQRIALNTTGNQWPVSLFTLQPGKGSDPTVLPAGDRYLSASDIGEVQRRGLWVSDRSQTHSVIVAVPSRTGQVLASQIPLSYFVDALNSLPRSNGIKRYLLSAGGDPLDGSAAPSSEERDLCNQLLQEGEGFLSTSDSLYSVARIPSTGWAIVVRYPASGGVTATNLDPGFLGGPTMVASTPMNGAGLPKGLILFPLGGVAVLFGVALVGWKQRWPGLEDGPIAFGENAIRSVAGPIRDRFSTRPPEPSINGLDVKALELTAFAAEVPTKLPAALGGEDVEFLRTEQVRNLRELWSHTEERLSGQRNWVREEVRRVHDASTTSIAELASLVNLAEQRLEDSRAAWNDVHASLLSRIDEARTSLGVEQEERLTLGSELKDELGELRSEFTETDERLESDVKALHSQLQSEFGKLDAAIAATLQTLTELDDREAGNAKQLASATERLDTEMGGILSRTRQLEDLLSTVQETLNGHRATADERLDTLSDRLTEQRHAEQSLREQLAEVVETTVPLMRDELEALRKELASKVAEVHEKLDGSLEETAAKLSAHRDEVQDLREQLRRIGDEALPGLRSEHADLGERLGREVSSLQEQLSALEQRQGEAFSSFVADHGSGLKEVRSELETLRKLESHLTQLDKKLAEQSERVDEFFTLEDQVRGLVLRTDERFAALEARYDENVRSADKAIEAFRETLEQRLKGYNESVERMDKRVEAANKRVLEQADELEATNELLYGHDDRLDAIADQLTGQVEELEGLTTRLSTTESILKAQQAEFQETLEKAQARMEAQLAADAQSLDALQRSQEELQDRTVEVDARVADLAERTDEMADQLARLSTRTEQKDISLEQRLVAFENKEHELSSQVEDLQKLSLEVRALPSEVGGLRGRIEGLSLAHTRQQEALQAAVQTLGELQASMTSRREDNVLQGRIDEMAVVIQHLAEQGRLLADAMEASAAAATRTEGWVADQLELLRSERNEALSNLEVKLVERDRENAMLREHLATMKESQEALANRMHMVVQVLSKLSK